MGITDVILGTKTTQPKANLVTPPQSGAGSGYASDNAATALDNNGNVYVPGPCNKNAQNGNQTPSTTVSVVFPSGIHSVFDTLVQMPKPTKRILICSLIQQDDAISRYAAISLGRTGLQDTGGLYSLTGTESWIPLPAALSFLIGTIIEFEYPIEQFFFQLMLDDTDTTVTLTFMDADNVKIHQIIQDCGTAA
jgi:hypothetical protein